MIALAVAVASFVVLCVVQVVCGLRAEQRRSRRVVAAIEALRAAQADSEVVR